MAETSGKRVSLLRARRIVADFRESPLSAEKYAQTKGMSPTTLRWYVKRVKAHEAKQTENSQVLQESIHSPAQAFITLSPESIGESNRPGCAASTPTVNHEFKAEARPPVLTLEFTELKCNLRIDEGVNPIFLKSVIKALGSCSS